jgi:DnaK suppressor protein
VTLRQQSAICVVLEAKAAELRELLQGADSIEAIAEPDFIDQHQQRCATEWAISDRQRWSDILREVEDAMRRLGTLAWGMCLDCDWPIGPKRLVAVPWAARCIGCQTEHERKTNHEGAAA